MPPNMRALVPSDAPPPAPVPVGGLAPIAFSRSRAAISALTAVVAASKAWMIGVVMVVLSPSTRPGETRSMPVFRVAMALVPAVCSSDDEVMAPPNSSANFFVMVSAICLSLAFSCKALMSIRPFTDSSMIPAPNFWTIDFASSCVSPKTFAHGESAPRLATSAAWKIFSNGPLAPGAVRSGNISGTRPFSLSCAVLMSDSI